MACIAACFSTFFTGCSAESSTSSPSVSQESSRASTANNEIAITHAPQQWVIRGNDSATDDAQEPSPFKLVASSAKGNKEPVDPVKANGPIFQGWPKPKFTVVISGLQDGYIEPCGCAGLENQKGGLARKHTLLKELTADGWNPVPIDLGGLIKRFGKQQELKYTSTLDGLKTMEYQAVGFGPDDLRQPGEAIFAATQPVGDEIPPFVSANVTVFGEPITPYKILQVAGKKIGVTAVLGKSYQSKVPGGDGVEIADPVAALKPVVEKLKAARCDLMILLSHSSMSESESLAKAYPQFHFVVTAGGAEEPPSELQEVPGTRTRLVEVGHKGMYVAVLGFFDDRQHPVRYQRVPLDHRFKDAPEMKQVMASYQDQLKQYGFELLGINPKKNRHPSGHRFVGSETCSQCHSKAHETWSGTGHAHATQTLVDLEIPRHYDPECLSCHTTGWDPQKYVPFDSGFLGLETTPELTSNGCENCHGPGSTHAAIELGELQVDAANRKKYQLEMRVAKHEDACMKCHDLDNSPEFVKEGGFEEYWPKVEHYGKD